MRAQYDAIIFTGPTIAPLDAAGELDALYLPPAEEGDVYSAAEHRPRVIGIIDGYFERVPAVWHKEILWAMSQGIHVFGSASMGALRAAELAAFGMEGVGKIFESYRDGILEDDDEVAIEHASGEFGYRAASEAMVNIRATLDKAQEAAVVSEAARLALQRIAKNLFYPQRNYPRVLEIAAQEGLAAEDLAAFRDWLPQGMVNRKREDAVAMLQTIRRAMADGLPPKQVRYSFVRTFGWDQARSRGRLDQFFTQSRSTLDGDLLDELRLSPQGYWPAYRAAMARVLAKERAQQRGAQIGPAEEAETTAAFRRESDLTGEPTLARWQADNQLSAEQFAAMMREEAQVRWAQLSEHAQIIEALPDYLRITNEYATLAARAKDKTALEHSPPTLADTGMTEEELLEWCFVEVLGRKAPQGDVLQGSRELGFDTPDAWRRAAIREFVYRRTAGLGSATIP